MAPRTAHFEEVREIRSEINIYPDLSQPLVEIPALIACAVPQEVSSREVQEVVLQNQHPHWVEQMGFVRSQVSDALSSRRVDDSSNGRSASTVR